jgi:hypothetical protein
VSTVTEDVLAGYIRECEAVDVTGVTRRTLRLWRQRRYGPPWVKMGRNTILYPKQGILDWLEANEVRSSGGGRS